MFKPFPLRTAKLNQIVCTPAKMLLQNSPKLELLVTSTLIVRSLLLFRPEF